MTTLAHERSGNVFASTHNSRFLMGCVESGKPLNIVRLTHKEDQSTARVLPNGRIQELMRDPLMRSAGVLEALFYFGAVICEADADRVFYGEINNRLQAAGRRHVSDSIFLNAQNKQTLRRMVGPLREMGIPAAAVADFDIIKDGALKDLLNVCCVPREVVTSLGQLRGDVAARFQERGLDMKNGGITLLDSDPDAREACQSLLQRLEEYGIFVVPGGELESWLGWLGVTGRKNDWLPDIFDRMKIDPADPAYVRPASNDVWIFLERIAEWIDRDDRLGMPRKHSR